MSNDFFEDLLNPDTANQYIEQGSPEWDKLRVGRFTASEMHLLMSPAYREMTDVELKNRPKSGKGSKTTRIEVYDKLGDAAETYVKIKVAETLTGKLKQTSYAFPLVYGKEMEDEARDYFCEKKGIELNKIGFISFGDHAGGSPDGVNQTDIAEFKCPFAIDTQVDYLLLSDQNDLKEFKPEYYYQCQTNLLFSGKDRCHFATYDPRYPEPQRLTHMIITPDARAFDMITAKIAAAVKLKLEILKLIQA